MKRIYLLPLMACMYCSSASAQNIDTSEIESFDEILVSSQRFAQKRSESPRQIEVLSSKSLTELVPATLGDALISSGKVFVQKSQMGGSSPVLRGFEASRVLLVVDGIRMNNATYRAGHLQDIITVDPFILDRMEINFGSGSTLFGSDALGGVIFLKTKDPQLGQKKWKLNANSRYFSSSNSAVLNAGVQFQSPKFGWMFNVTNSNFGDLRMGSKSYYKADSKYAEMPEFVSQIKGKDTVLLNNNALVQKGTGYSQNDLFTKFKFRAKRLDHILNIQGSFSSVIPRYDRMSLRDAQGKFSFGRWDYAPQNRQLIAYTLQNLVGNSRLVIANQRTQVGRVTRPFGSVFERTQLDHVSMWTLNADRQNKWGNFTLNYGGEFAFNNVKSRGTNKNILNGAETLAKARYSDSGAQTYSTGVFAQGLYKWKNTVIQSGARLTHYSLHAFFSNSNPWKLPYNKISFKNTGLSYDFGLTQKMGDFMMIKISYNQAFRNPNVDDMTKVFESTRGIKLLIPSPNLKAEVSRTVDIGWAISHKKFGSGELGIYRSTVSNLLLDQPGQFNGSDSLLWDGAMTKIYQMVNISSATIWGYYGNARIRIWKDLWANGSYTFTQGRFNKLSFSKDEPLDHIPPIFGQLALRYNLSEEIFCEVQYLFNGRKLAKDYSSSGEDNANQNPPGGNPNWGIYNLRLGYQRNGLSLQLSAENLMDLRYRYFASGVTASGRSLNISLGIRI